MNKYKLLSGIKVLDLSRILVGPYCTMLLSDMGAEVIKVESPEGDETRKWGPPFINGDSTYFMSINRNKKSIAMNFKKQESKDIINKLVKSSDIVIENFAKGKTEEFGISYNDLKKVNDKIIYASINGYGDRGPMSYKPAFDLIMQAYCGIMNITGEQNGNPYKVGYAICDILTASHIYGAIMNALLYKERTGEGQYINTSLLEVSLFSNPTTVSAFINGNLNIKRKGNDHANISPYTSFRTNLDNYLVIGVATDYQFKHLWEALEINYDISKYDSNLKRINEREKLKSIIQENILKFEEDELFKRLDEGNIAYSKINSMEDLFNGQNEQIEALNIVNRIHSTNYGNLSFLNNPIKYSKLSLEEHVEPPKLGQHTKEILSKLNFSEEEINNLYINKVIY